MNRADLGLRLVVAGASSGIGATVATEALGLASSLRRLTCAMSGR